MVFFERFLSNFKKFSNSFDDVFHFMSINNTFINKFINYSYENTNN